MDKSGITEPRVCQRGVDGSEGCGHDSSFSNLTPVGVCKVIVGEDVDGPTYCGHRCEFTFDNLLTPEEVDLVVGAIPLQALPHDSNVKVSRHTGGAYVEDPFIEREWAKKPSPAPYHRSLEYAHLDLIKRALGACEKNRTKDRPGDTIVLFKSDWEALKNAIK